MEQKLVRALDAKEVEVRSRVQSLQKSFEEEQRSAREKMSDEASMTVERFVLNISEHKVPHKSPELGISHWRSRLYRLLRMTMVLIFERLGDHTKRHPFDG